MLKAEIIFTDDLELRDAVKSSGSTPVGTIGILVRSWRDQLISKEELNLALNILMEESSLYITEDLIHQVRNAIK